MLHKRCPSSRSCQHFPFFFPLLYLASLLIMPVICAFVSSANMLGKDWNMSYFCIHTVLSTKSLINVIELNATSGQNLLVCFWNQEFLCCIPLFINLSHKGVQNVYLWDLNETCTPAALKRSMPLLMLPFFLECPSPPLLG